MYIASEKLAIIRLVEDSKLSIRRTLTEINVSRSSFYHPDRGAGYLFIRKIASGRYRHVISLKITAGE